MTTPEQQLKLSKFNDYSGQDRPHHAPKVVGGKSITVFCWSRTEPGSALWQQAEHIGTLAAERGFSVVTGGYGGSMEAVSKGAATSSSSSSSSPAPAPSSATATTVEAKAVVTTATTTPPEVVGILVPGQFPDRRLVGNAFLTRSMDANNLSHRLDLLTSQSRYYVVLPGTLGTLTELVLIWSLSLLHAPALPKPLIICFRDPWERMVQHIAQDLALPANETQLLTFVDTAEEAMEIIAKDDAAISAAAAAAVA